MNFHIPRRWWTWLECGKQCSGAVFTGDPFHCCTAKRHAGISSWAGIMMDRSDEEVLETGGDHDDKEIVSKRGVVSVVWRFFSFKKSNVDQTTISCKCCRAKVVVGGGNTGNLLHHLNWKHVVEYQECMKLRSASTTSSNTSETVKPKSSQVSLEDTFAWGTAYEKKSKQRNVQYFSLKCLQKTITLSYILLIFVIHCSKYFPQCANPEKYLV